MRRQKGNVVLLLLLGILVVAGVILVTRKGQTTDTSQALALPLQPAVATENTDVHSSDGTKKIIMRVTNTNGSKTYSFSTADIGGTNETAVFSYQAPEGVTLSIPANTWSPNNKYVFIKETSPTGFDFWVLREKGEAFANGDKYLSVSTLFGANQPKLKLRDVTGWDADLLLNVKSANEDSTKGPTFWFDVTSRAFIQLWR